MTEYEADTDLSQSTPVVWLIIIILIIAIAVIATSVWYEWDIVSPASAIGSLILSGLLVIMYVQQAQTQVLQADIMETQNKLMEAEYRPIIDIESFHPRVKSQIESYEYDYDLNSIKIRTKNVGNGIAIDPQFFIEIDVEDSDRHTRLSQPLVPVSRENSGVYDSLLRSLPADDNIKEFECPVYAQIKKDNEEETVLFPYAVEKIYNDGFDWLKVRFGITVEDIEEKTHEFEIGLFKVNLPGVIENEVKSPDSISREDANLTNPVEELSFYRTFQQGLFSYTMSIQAPRKETEGERDESYDIEWPNKMPEMTRGAIHAGARAGQVSRRSAGSNNEPDSSDT